MSTELLDALSRARVLADAGKLAEARAAVEALAGSLGDEATQSSLWHHVRGALAMRARDLDVAVREYEEAARLEPAVGEHKGGVGTALLEKARDASGDAQKALILRALDVLEEAWGLRPLTPDVGTSLAFALQLTGDPARGLAILDDVLARHPGHVPAMFNKASALAALGQNDEARAVLDEVLRAAPGFAPAVQARTKL